MGVRLVITSPHRVGRTYREPPELLDFDRKGLHPLRLARPLHVRMWRKGPSLEPGERRLAVQVEDHPLEYGAFEGTIPKGQYGAGSVRIWDRGAWTPVGDPHEGLKRGHLVFDLRGEKLVGRWALIKIRGRADKSGGEKW